MKSMRSMFLKIVLLTLILVVNSTSALADTMMPDGDALNQLLVEFDDVVRVSNKGNVAIEFCPDNTCEAFIGKNTVPLSAVADFAYLYLFYFSDYFMLTDWRKKTDAVAFVEKIISKPAYAGCSNELQIEKAKCVMRKISKAGMVNIFDYRYDEHVRFTHKKNISKVISAKP